jgi:hypothetical protein
MLKRLPMRGRILALVACLALWPLATPLAQEEPPPRFQVEVLVFLQPEGSSVELPPPLPPAGQLVVPGGDAAVPAGEQSGAATPAKEPLAGTSERELPAGFVRPLEPLQLENAAAALRRRGYVPLWHQAWIQPPAGRDGVDLPLLAALGQGPSQPGLEGAISLSQGRFLHLGLELRWQPTGVLEAEMKQRRRLRTGDEHYFDHPRLGVLAVVQRVAYSPGTGSAPESESAAEP